MMMMMMITIGLIKCVVLHKPAATVKLCTKKSAFTVRLFIILVRLSSCGGAAANSSPWKLTATWETYPSVSRSREVYVFGDIHFLSSSLCVSLRCSIFLSANRYPWRRRRRCLFGSRRRLALAPKLWSPRSSLAGVWGGGSGTGKPGPPPSGPRPPSIGPPASGPSPGSACAGSWAGPAPTPPGSAPSRAGSCLLTSAPWAARVVLPRSCIHHSLLSDDLQCEFVGVSMVVEEVGWFEWNIVWSYLNLPVMMYSGAA